MKQKKLKKIADPSLTFEEKIQFNYNQLDTDDVKELCNEVISFINKEHNRTKYQGLSNLGDLAYSVVKHIDNFKTISFKQYKVLKGYCSTQSKLVTAQEAKDNEEIIIIK